MNHIFRYMNKLMRSRSRTHRILAKCKQNCCTWCTLQSDGGFTAHLRQFFLELFTSKGLFCITIRNSIYRKILQNHVIPVFQRKINTKIFKQGVPFLERLLTQSNNFSSELELRIVI